MDAYADTLVSGYETAPRFQLSIAAPAGADNYANLPLGEISQATDFINLMVSSYPLTNHITNDLQGLGIRLRRSLGQQRRPHRKLTALTQ
jgi:hypothetical protein